MAAPSSPLIPPDNAGRSGDSATVRVLVVEDEPLYAEQLESLLLGIGYETVGPAASAQIALALYRTEVIDLVLLDITLRGTTNGIQLAERLLAYEPVPLIFLTSFADETTFQQAQAVGPAAYLTKPVSAEVLRRAISLAVRNFGRHSWPSSTEVTALGAAVPEAIFVKENGLLVKIKVHDIFSVAADNKRCHLTLVDRSIPMRMSLREVAQQLPARLFIQIQRSYFVNIAHIERLDPGSYLVQVGKQVLPVGRLYMEELINRLYTIT